MKVLSYAVDIDPEDGITHYNGIKVELHYLVEYMSGVINKDSELVNTSLPSYLLVVL